ncbi:hypothetical protein BT96DRAFT_1092393, partial [Gymnopus androsaceus JB14]
MNVVPGGVRSNISQHMLANFSLPVDLLYSEFLPNIMKQFNVSQTKNSMPTAAFAKAVSKALRKRPPLCFSMGGNSTIFAIFR